MYYLFPVTKVLQLVKPSLRILNQMCCFAHSPWPVPRHFLVGQQEVAHQRWVRGALEAMKQLEQKGMGKLVVKKFKVSIKVCSVSMCAHTIVHEIDPYMYFNTNYTWEFQKTSAPNNQEGKAKMAKLLAESYNISLLDYVWSFTSTDEP